MGVHFVDTWGAAKAACARLREAPSDGSGAGRVLAFDMEGAPLGTHTSLLQLAFSPYEIYVFDVITLGQSLFDASHLLPILTDPKILKLCYDCRGDAGALFHQHRVRAYGFYDLQIVYASLFPTQHSNGFLRGLHRALECTLAPQDACAFTERKMALKQRWRMNKEDLSLRQRPLLPETVTYAAADVAHLFDMFRQWSPFFTQRSVVATSTLRMLNSLAAFSSPQKKAHIDFVLLRPLRPYFVVVRKPPPTDQKAEEPMVI